MTAAPPPPPPDRNQSRRWVPWAVVAGVAVVVLTGGGIALALTLSGGSPGSVEDVADRAVDAAQELDVSAGVDLLCDPPANESRELLDALIADAQERTGEDDPDVTIDVSDVDDGAAGRFTATISSADAEFAGVIREVHVVVADRDGRSCIERFEFPMPGQDPVIVDKDGISEP